MIHLLSTTTAIHSSPTRIRATRKGSAIRQILAMAAFIGSVLTTHSASFAQAVQPCPAPLNLTLTAPSMPYFFPADFSTLSSNTIAQRAGLNDHSHNKNFLCTFRWDKKQCCQVTKAVLTVKMWSNQNGTSHTTPDAGNDRIGLYYNGAGIAGPPSDWVYPAPPPFPINTPSTKVWTITGAAFTQMCANDRLSFLVEDDTRVESATLIITGCCVNP